VYTAACNGPANLFLTYGGRLAGSSPVSYVHVDCLTLQFNYVFRIVTLVCVIALACCPDVRRNFPINIIFLGIFVSVHFFLLTDSVLVVQQQSDAGKNSVSYHFIS